jgi:kynureninase
MPRGVFDQMQNYAGTWAERGVRAWGEGWWDMPVRVGDLVARLMGAPPGTVSMHQNATSPRRSCSRASTSRRSA